MSLTCPNMYLLKQKRPISILSANQNLKIGSYWPGSYFAIYLLYHSFLIMPVLGKYFFWVSHSLFYYSRKTGPAGPPLAHCTVVVLSFCPPADVTGRCGAERSGDGAETETKR